MYRQFATFTLAALLATGASAQGPQAGSHNPVVKDGAPHMIHSPAKGANSFTEDQARGRFAKAGYSRISKLNKEDGLWRGTAVKNGKKKMVMLDYKGNVTAR